MIRTLTILVAMIINDITVHLVNENMKKMEHNMVGHDITYRLF